MRIGASLVLIALGAILKFAVTASVHGVNLGVVGVVLMIVGAIGLICEGLYVAGRRRHVVQETVVHDQPYSQQYVADDRVAPPATRPRY